MKVFPSFKRLDSPLGIEECGHQLEEVDTEAEELEEETVAPIFQNELLFFSISRMEEKRGIFSQQRNMFLAY